MVDNWIVLRCSAGSTIRLMEELCCRGLTAWAPVFEGARRSPRSSKKALAAMAMMPTFVFLNEDDRSAAFALQKSRYISLGFSVMRFNGKTVKVKDGQLEPLREKKLSRVDLDKMKFPDLGSQVLFTTMPYQGLRGVVVALSKRSVSVNVSGSDAVVKIPPFLLSWDEA